MGSYLNTDDTMMKQVLSQAKTIAVVGHSDNPRRTSYQIAQYLRHANYTVYAVNPTIDNIDGETSYASLADVPVPIDIVNVFRRSEYLKDVVQQAVEVGVGAIWAQLGVDDPQARTIALDADIHIATDRCIKVEHRRLEV